MTKKLVTMLATAVFLVACGGTGGTKEDTGNMAVSIGGVQATVAQTSAGLRKGALSQALTGSGAASLAAVRGVVVVLSANAANPGILAAPLTTSLAFDSTTPFTGSFSTPVEFGPLKVGKYDAKINCRDGAGNLLFTGEALNHQVNKGTHDTLVVTLQQQLDGSTVAELAPFIKNISVSDLNPTFGEQIELIADVEAWNLDCNVGDCYFDTHGGKHCVPPLVQVADAIYDNWDNLWKPVWLTKNACTFAWASNQCGHKNEAGIPDPAFGDLFSAPASFDTKFDTQCSDGVEKFTFCVTDSASTMTITDGVPTRHCSGTDTYGVNKNCPIMSCVNFNIPYGSQSLKLDIKVDSNPDISCISPSNGEPAAGDAITVSCLASDGDGDQLTYAWTSTCHTGNGSFADSTAASTTWTAPQANKDDCVLTCAVSDGNSITKGTLSLTTAPVPVATN